MYGVKKIVMMNIKYLYKSVITYEKKQYMQYMFPSLYRYFMSRIKRESARMIWRWQKTARIKDYYDEMRSKSKNPWYKFMYLLNVCKCNRYAEPLGLDIGTKNIGKGLMIYHGNSVVNSFSEIGENLHLHGVNVIGNIGPDDPSGCPVVGNNVMLGAGAKVLGRVVIADNIKVGAGAVVVHSFTEPGITIAGVPARKVSK